MALWVVEVRGLDRPEGGDADGAKGVLRWGGEGVSPKAEDGVEGVGYDLGVDGGSAQLVLGHGLGVVGVEGLDNGDGGGAGEPAR